ncbi:peroxisome assembly protein per8 [Pholiota conissans]|uniref:RING-type E3 ubiquitin transferase n=1 Tax=Pholiota conissans TaxID=109636 RepID=A0A9P6CZW4_9AGAR|nr:peroxisome assembly protein per8 [Pholiota conissans]
MTTLPASPSLSFPHAQQAQIIRANQRDLYHVSSLKDQAESVLRAWLGTRWLTRWDKELDLLVKLCYYGLTTGRAIQTLGEEYTDIWQHSSHNSSVPPSASIRAVLIIVSLVPSYVLGRWGQSQALIRRHPNTAKGLRKLPHLLDAITEVNLAIFYMKGTYYDLVKRLIGIQHISSLPEDPHTRPPSYSLLGIMIGVRLLYRLLDFIRYQKAARASDKSQGKHSADIPREIYLDDRLVSSLLDEKPEGEPAKPAEEDEGTALDVSLIPEVIRQSRNCTLCLEERTDSCATECGHMFCWNCIVGWGREKAECPLCRQALSLDHLLPIYNL